MRSRQPRFLGATFQLIDVGQVASAAMSRSTSAQRAASSGRSARGPSATTNRRFGRTEATRRITSLVCWGRLNPHSTTGVVKSSPFRGITVLKS